MKNAALCSIAVLGLWLTEPAHAETRRLAIIASSNDGGAARVQLRYANRDARAVAQVLSELGGVARADQTLLPDVSRADLVAVLHAARAQLQAMRRQGQRVELLFYYSGHSDEQGLLLGAERFDYAELRKTLNALPADVRVAIVDACASGMLTRRKGGTRRPAFMVDQASAVRGMAILTSSSGSEASQESDAINASFFTHYLVTALRGAADRDQDGRVTLSEAYQFTFDETLARTERTQSGAQHPSYDMHLSGTGDLVLTDLRQVDAQLVLGPGTGGQLRVRDAGGGLIAELRKRDDEELRLGLWPGDYSVSQERAGKWALASLRLGAGQEGRLGAQDFVPVAAEPSVARGGTVIPGERPVSALELGLVPGLSTNRLSPQKSINLLSATMIGGDTTVVYGVGLGLLSHSVSDWLIGLQLSPGFNAVGGRVYGAQLAGGANLADAPLAALQLAGGANIAGRHFDTGQIAGGVNLAWQGLNGVQLGGLFNLTGGPLNGLQWALAGVNLSTAELRGAQIGLVNLSDSVTGGQIGLVNLAHEVTGTQLGLVNVAGSVRGAPLGLVSVIGDGRFEIEASSDDVHLLSTGLRFGNDNAYSVIGVGLQPLGEQPHGALGFGLGARLPLPGAFSLHADLSSQQVWRGQRSIDHLDLLNRLRLGGAFQLVPSLGFMAGLSLNALFTQVPEAAPLSFSPALARFGEQTRLDLWPGLYLGLLL